MGIVVQNKWWPKTEKHMDNLGAQKSQAAGGKTCPKSKFRKTGHRTGPSPCWPARHLHRPRTTRWSA